MKTKKNVRNLFTLVMVFAMLFTCAGFQAFADASVEDDGSLPQPQQAEEINNTDETTDVEYGIKIDAESSDDLEVDVEKDVNVDRQGDAAGAEITNDGGDVTLSIGGEMNINSSEGNATGLSIENNGTTTIETGEIEVEGKKEAVGAEIYSMGGELILEGDDIEAESTGEEGRATGLLIESVGDGKVKISADEIEAEGKNAAGTVISAEGKSEIDIESREIEADTIGLVLEKVSSEANVDILVTETIKGDEIGILVNDAVSNESYDITVYEIKTEDGKQILAKLDSDGNLTQEGTDEVAKRIHYIIKVDPDQKDLITLEGTTKSHGYDTAREGEKVVMKIKVPNGYELKKAYGDEGKELKLLRDGSENYYVVVPRGGAVYLSADLDKIETGDPNADYVVVSFDLNGGHTPDKKTHPFVKRVSVGTWVVLIDAPAREGSTFEKWYTKNEGVTVSAPGQAFRVEDNITFIAKWEGEEIS